jgi:predicted nucleic acid-binding protein
VAGKADILVSGDGDLLALAGKTKFAILAPAQLLSDLKQ